MHAAQSQANGTMKSATSVMFVLQICMEFVLPFAIAHMLESIVVHLRSGRQIWLIRFNVAFYVAIFIAVGGNLVTMSVLGTGGEAGKVLGMNILVFVSLELSIACGATLLGLICLVFGYMEHGHLVELSHDVQSRSPFKYVWAATHSMLRPRKDERAFLMGSRQDNDVREWELERVAGL
jgi:hypothetical protein